ncbi:MAG: ribosome maturation factor RimM [Spirochaetales bacterium]
MARVSIAKILKPQGLKGQVKVMPYGEDASVFEKGKTLLLKNNAELKIESSSVRSSFLYINFEGFNTIEEVETLRSKELFILEDELPDLKKGEYYVKDLLDMEVYGTSGDFLGTVVEIENFGSADVYTLKNGLNEVTFAFVTGLFEKVNFDENKIVVNSKLFEEVVV